MFSKIGGKPTKMDGENNGKPLFFMDDLGGKIPLFLVQHPILCLGEVGVVTCISFLVASVSD